MTQPIPGWAIEQAQRHGPYGAPVRQSVSGDGSRIGDFGAVGPRDILMWAEDEYRETSDAALLATITESLSELAQALPEYRALVDAADVDALVWQAAQVRDS